MQVPSKLMQKKETPPRKSHLEFHLLNDSGTGKFALKGHPHPSLTLRYAQGFRSGQALNPLLEGDVG